MSRKEIKLRFRIDQLRVVNRLGILRKKGHMGEVKGKQRELPDGGTHFFLPPASDASDAGQIISNTHWFLIAVG